MFSKKIFKKETGITITDKEYFKKEILAFIDNQYDDVVDDMEDDVDVDELLNALREYITVDSDVQWLNNDGSLVE